ncbi:MAG TPA: SDR family NAD(P)-dependent oxidoreductase, partial [Blastocatellia bacterium]|nr:SDR family NAD(P)-dependent oxidoreductase [Blastocatellia bacterium]
SRKLMKVREIEARGAEVEVVSADVTDEEEMRSVVGRVYARYGQLNGVLHAAGITSGTSVFNLITDIGPAESEAQFRPKVYGTYVLERVLRDKDVDFVMLFSSNAAVLGGLGFAAYSAANAFMDAFAYNRNNNSRTTWISANWDHWPEETKRYTGFQTSMDQYTMTVEESQEAFRRVACMAPGGQVIVSTGDLFARLDLWIRRESPEAASGPSGDHSAAPAHDRANLPTLYVPPSNESERIIANIWQELLGTDRVGIHDNFFDLGGHSLLAIRMVGRLNDAFKMDIPLGRLFSSPTVAGLAQAIADLKDEQRTEDHAEILNIVAQLSEEEIEAEIRKRTETIE